MPWGYDIRVALLLLLLSRYCWSPVSVSWFKLQWFPHYDPSPSIHSELSNLGLRTIGVYLALFFFSSYCLWTDLIKSQWRIQSK